MKSIELVKLGLVWSHCENCENDDMESFKAFAFRTKLDENPKEFYIHICRNCLHTQTEMKI